MDWKEKAIHLLKDSLYPIPTELNELDWKSGLSENTDRLAQHLSAFANLKGGGILVFGIHNDGSCFDLSREEVEKTVQTIGNIALNNLIYPIQIEHAVMAFEGHPLLFIYIPEQTEKPVYLRGRDVFTSYHRSAGQTVKMSRNQVKAMIAASQGVTFEMQVALGELTSDEVLKLLNYRSLYQILDKNVPSSTDSIINRLNDFHLCENENGKWNITNMWRHSVQFHYPQT